MGWHWNEPDLVILDEYLAGGPPEVESIEVRRALLNLMEHAEDIEGDEMPGQWELFRKVVVAGVEIVFFRAEHFRTLRLISITPPER